MSRRPPPEHRHIYVIGPEVGLQKVGIATDPRQRLATLQTACPFDLLLHLAIAVPFSDALAIERKAHRLLARSCVRNEWFETTRAEAIAAVQAAVVPRLHASGAPAHAPPAEWRISRAKRIAISPPSPPPGFRKPPSEGAPRPPSEATTLPLFSYAREAEADDMLAERVMRAMARRIGR